MPYESRPRGDARSKVYGSRRWQETRKATFERDDYTCVICGKSGNICDHYPLPLIDLIQAGGDPYDPDGCRTLCAVCSGHVDGARSHGDTPKAKKANPFLTTMLTPRQP